MAVIRAVIARRSNFAVSFVVLTLSFSSWPMASGGSVRAAASRGLSVPAPANWLDWRDLSFCASIAASKPGVSTVIRFSDAMI